MPSLAESSSEHVQRDPIGELEHGSVQPLWTKHLAAKSDGEIHWTHRTFLGAAAQR
jgi:hypothetical protein